MYFDNCPNIDAVKAKFARFAQCVKGDAEIIEEIKKEYQAKIEPPTTGSPAERLEKLIKWGSTRIDFDVKFLLSLKEKVDQGFMLSEKQVSAIDNIIAKFKLKF